MRKKNPDKPLQNEEWEDITDKLRICGSPLGEICYWIKLLEKRCKYENGRIWKLRER